MKFEPLETRSPSAQPVHFWEMRRKKLQFRSMWFWLCLSVSSQAFGMTSFYVDNSGSPPCSDSPTSGSASSPWCTINYGISHLKSGDTLYVKAGTYREDIRITGPAGVAGSPTAIRAYPGHTVTILGSGVNTGRVKIANTSYITLDGFIITNFNQGVFVENSDHVVVQNNTVHHVGQEGIHVHLNSSFVVVENNTIHNTRQWQYNGEGIYIGSGSTSPRDNTHNVTVRNNTIYNTNDEAIELKSGTHDNVVEGNLIYNATTDPSWQATWGAIEIDEPANGNQYWGSNPNHFVRNNIIHSSKTAIRAGTGCTVYNNLIYNTRSSYYGIYVDNLMSDSYPRRIYHNTVDIPSSRAIIVSSGPADIKNNIGPATANNIPTSDSYYRNKAGANYHLASMSAPINAGLDFINIVPTDIEGMSRLTHPPSDLGAYEYVEGSRPAPPTNVGVQ
jgi:parallel beta-helix repeat protein